MTEPLKPRIDFTGPLEQEQQEAFKTAQTFSGRRRIILRLLRKSRLLMKGRQKLSLKLRCA
jgi:hypothetical protein